jgi:hypothetical protein
MIGAWVPKSYRNFGLMKIIDKQIEAGKVIKIERGLYRLAD